MPVWDYVVGIDSQIKPAYSSRLLIGSIVG
jgi:hypothetical protein